MSSLRENNLILTEGEWDALNKRLQRAKQLTGLLTDKEVERRRKHALAMARRRANETAEQTAERRRKNAERQRRKRQEVREMKQALFLREWKSFDQGNLDYNDNGSSHALTFYAADEKPDNTECNPADYMKETTVEVPDKNAFDLGSNLCICHACSSSFDNTVEYFNHIQQQSCLTFYNNHPDILAKILSYIKSNLSDPSSNLCAKADNEMLEVPKSVDKICDSCGKNFANNILLPLDDGPESDGPSFCEDCQSLRLSSAQCTIKKERNPSGEDNSCTTYDKYAIEQVDLDFLPGVVQPERPLLTSQLDLPEYISPLGFQVPIKNVRMPYSKAEPYKMHRCWECDKPIIPTTKRFLDHFKVLYECQWCIYKTHCKVASMDHVLRYHADEETRVQLQSSWVNSPSEEQSDAVSLPIDSSITTDARNGPENDFVGLDCRESHSTPEHTVKLEPQEDVSEPSMFQSNKHITNDAMQYDEMNRLPSEDCSEPADTLRIIREPSFDDAITTPDVLQTDPKTRNEKLENDSSADENALLPIALTSSSSFDKDVLPQYENGQQSTCSPPNKDNRNLVDWHGIVDNFIVSPPLNLRCLSITATSLLVQWDRPPQCAVANYQILFQGCGGPSQLLIPAENTLVRLTHLSPNTMYVVRVYTVTKQSISQCAIMYRKTNQQDSTGQCV